MRLVNIFEISYTPTPGSCATRTELCVSKCEADARWIEIVRSRRDITQQDVRVRRSVREVPYVLLPRTATP